MGLAHSPSRQRADAAAGVVPAAARCGDAGVWWIETKPVRRGAGRGIAAYVLAQRRVGHRGTPRRGGVRQHDQVLRSQLRRAAIEADQGDCADRAAMTAAVGVLVTPLYGITGRSHRPGSHLPDCLRLGGSVGVSAFRPAGCAHGCVDLAGIRAAPQSWPDLTAERSAIAVYPHVRAWRALHWHVHGVSGFFHRGWIYPRCSRSGFCGSRARLGRSRR